MIIIIIAKRKTRSWKRRKENVYLSYLGLFVLPCNLSSQAQPHAFGSPGPTLVHWPIPRVYVCVGIVLWIRLEFFPLSWGFGDTARQQADIACGVSLGPGFSVIPFLLCLFF